MVKLSKPSKMPCLSWSLEARETCPGSIDPKTKQVVDVCSGCYATEGFYRMPTVKDVRAENRKDWQRKEWVAEMIAEISNQTPDDKGKRYFRWFDSGDVYHPDLAKKIFEVMKWTPNVKHWLPTKSYKVPKIKKYLENMKQLPNVSVRYSSDSINGEYDAIHGSTVIPDADFPTKARVCGAYDNDGKCGDCRSCWNKKVKVIAYPAHGHKIKKVNVVLTVRGRKVAA